MKEYFKDPLVKLGLVMVAIPVLVGLITFPGFTLYMIFSTMLILGIAILIIAFTESDY